MPRPNEVKLPRLIFGDCLKMMARIEDGSVDLILCDLPYGTTACRRDVIIPFEPLWDHYRRIVKKGGAVVLTASQPFTSKLVMSNPKWFRYEWIWHKNMPTGFLDANRKPLKDHESILVFCEKAAPYSPQGVDRRRRRRRKSGTEVYGKFGFDYETTGEGFPRSVIKFANGPRNGHQNAKPVPLFEYLVRTYSDPGDMVMDNAMGSGTTGLACHNAGRSFIGIESDHASYMIAENRIDSTGRVRHAAS
jgi:site-specific DNA-methyltransferase (adenine-specific)